MLPSLLNNKMVLLFLWVINGVPLCSSQILHQFSRLCALVDESGNGFHCELRVLHRVLAPHSIGSSLRFSASDSAHSPPFCQDHFEGCNSLG
ncbi:hypothetical protein P3S68_022119 [Capsicum galapagoense]